MQYNPKYGMVKVPVGVALPWFPHLIPELPPNYVECNGQTIEDPTSPLNGKAIPNLNNGFYLVGGAEADSGKAVGSNGVSLSAANLPAATLTGTASSVSAGTPSGNVTVASGGAHTHTITDPGHSHAVKGSATGLLTGIVGNAMNASGLTTSNTNPAATGISLQSGGAHTHTATFAGAALPTHSHSLSVPLNAGTQTPLDIRPASVVVRWVMRVK